METTNYPIPDWVSQYHVFTRQIDEELTLAVRINKRFRFNPNFSLEWGLLTPEGRWNKYTPYYYEFNNYIATQKYDLALPTFELIQEAQAFCLAEAQERQDRIKEGHDRKAREMDTPAKRAPMKLGKPRIKPVQKKHQVDENAVAARMAAVGE